MLVYRKNIAFLIEFSITKLVKGEFGAYFKIYHSTQPMTYGLLNKEFFRNDNWYYD